MTPVLTTNIPGLRLVARGKVRDVYELDEQHLLFVATDRISAFDVVMPTGIPDKGRILTEMSRFWFQFLSDLVPNHLAPEVRLPEHLAEYASRSMVVRKAKIFPVECVARGYVVGSGWKDYQRTGAICGVELPRGLRECDKLPEPIFTPATKATEGHDENISFEQAAAIIGSDYAGQLRDLTLRIYTKASEYAASKGILLADTKFEFGLIGGELVLADEVLTPDSSRYWPADRYEPGHPQPSFDKQYLREYLESIPWGKVAPGPELPADVVANTRAKYLEAYERLTRTI